MRILVFQHVESEHLGAFQDALDELGAAVVYHRIACGVAPPSAEEFDALISMGGPMSVYEQDRYSELADEMAAIRLAVRSGRPFLGVCLGAQLLAGALGGRVYPAGVKEIGFYTVDLTRDAGTDPILSGLPGSINVFQWHGDTFDIPDGSCLLATAGLCPNQAFRYGENAWGLQFHVEVTPKMVEQWAADAPGELAAVNGLTPERLTGEANAAYAETLAYSSHIMKRFAQAAARGTAR